MKITTHKTNQDLDDYLDYLGTRRIKELGNGYFSTVFQHPTREDVAVKVVAGDTQYLRFLRFASKYPKNPYLPKIYSVTKHVSSGSSYYIVMMEKLRKLPYQKYRKWRVKLKTGNTLAQFSHKLRELSKTCEDKHLREIFKFLYRNQFYFDLHGGNVMQRGDQLVIVDPMADA